MKSSNNKASLVFFHGWGFDSNIFKNFAGRLSHKYEVILIDIKKYDLADMVENILSQIPLGAVLVGWSLGGLLGVKLAELYPDRFNKIILLNTNPCFVEADQWPGVKAEIFAKFEEDLKTNPQRLLNKFGLLQGFEVKEYLKYPENNKELEILKEGLKYLGENNIIENLRNYNKDLLMVLSTNDVLVPVEVAEKIKDLNKNINIKILEGGTHVPFLAKPKELMGYFDEFI